MDSFHPLYLDNVAEFGQKGGQGGSVVVLQAQTVAEGPAVLHEQLADGEAEVLLGAQQLDELGRQGFDTLNLSQSQNLLLAALQHLRKDGNTSVKVCKD